MSLKEKINEDLKNAMRSGDKIRLSTIRSIRALILEFEKSGVNREMTEEDEIKMLTSAAKKRRESIEQFSKAGRTELAEKEKSELAVIEEYLPEQLSEEEIFEEIKNISIEIGAEDKKDFGKLMGAAMKKLKGKADGNVVRQLVTKALE